MATPHSALRGIPLRASDMNATKSAQILIRAIFIFWPVLLLVSLYNDAIRLFFWASLVLFLLRLALGVPELNRVITLADRAICLFGTAISISCLAFNVSIPILWYPVATNASLFVAFVGSLFFGRPVLESFAREANKGKELPEKAISHARKATCVWALFFLINGVVATLTALLADPKLWTLWNGCISYVLIALLAFVEYLFWRRVRKA